ncbi:MAG TPA: YybS family protein [Bacillota bacterium]|nr:YybS family protein [Bacillota bacterium]
MNDSKVITEGALLTVVYNILLVVALYFPLVGMIIFFILPIPFIIFASRYNWKPSLLMGAAAILLSIFIVGGVTMPMTILAAMGGIVTGCAIYKGLSTYETWAAGTIGFAAGFVFVYAFIQQVLKINIMEKLDESLNQVLHFIDTLGIASQIPDEVYQTFTEQVMMVKDLIPASIVMVSILFAFVNLWLSYKIKNALEQKQVAFPPFRLFNLPTSVIWIYFIALILTFFNLDQQSFLYVGVINVILLGSILLTIQGFSLIFCFAHIKKWSKAIPIISVVLGFVLPVLFYLIRILGIIDLGFSVKHRLSGEKK